MTKEYLLSKTLYGVDIFQHLIRKEFPDHIMHVKGDFVGECPDPVFADGGIIDIQVHKTYTEGKRLPDLRAMSHHLGGTIPEGDAIDLATAYYRQRGEALTEQQVIDRLAAELYIHEKDYIPYVRKTSRPVSPEATPDNNVATASKDGRETPSLPPCPKMSFYRGPIKNTTPCRAASPTDIFKYLRSDYAKAHTQHLRCLTDPKERRRYKAQNFNYITPGGLFRSRKESDIIETSGYMVIDFDHIADPAGLVKRLAHDDQFETALAFTSPSGDGVKWILALPKASKPDGTPFTYGEFFTILSNYVRKTYGMEADPSGKDICRACFLPHDPHAFINPFYLEDGYDYDITEFLDGSAE